VGVLGVIDDVEKRTAMAFGREGDVVLVLGETRDEFAGSEWAHVVHGHLGGIPPEVDLAAERWLAQVLVAGSRSGLLSAAHDVSDAGIAQALVEMSLRGGVGATVTVPDGTDPFVLLLSESTARAVVTVSPSDVAALESLAGQHGVPVTRLGVVGAPGADLVVENVYGGTASWSLEELRATADATLPALFG
jgi:phosphoribosylformylglycinamidine synthase